MTSKYRFRVALISYNFGEYCVRLASALAQHADVLLITPDGLIEPHVAKLHSSVQLFFFSKARLRQPVGQFRAIWNILRRIREYGPDVIHYQGAHLWFDLALPFLRRYPLVFTIHDFQPHPGDRLSLKTPLWVEMFARRRADELIVHSQFLRNVVTKNLPGAAGNITVIPHTQMGEDLPPSTSKEEDHLVLFFGRIWEYKGLEYLIRAEPLVTARVPDVRILIAGQGEDFSRYARMMVHPDRFIVHNEFIPEARAADYFRRASVVVLPYIEASQSGVIPMAYSAAKPVVATTVGGLPEIVEDGRTGYLVPPRDATQLADAVTRLLLDAQLRRQMGKNGKSKLERECSPRVIAQKTMEVYKRAVARGRPDSEESATDSSVIANFSKASYWSKDRMLMKWKSFFLCSILSLLSCVVPPTLRAQNSGFVYLANSPTSAQQPGSILGYSISDNTGALTPVPGLPFQTPLGAGTLAVTPSGQFLYTPSPIPGVYGGWGVAGYAIDANSGSLTPVLGSPFFVSTNFVAYISLRMDPSGKFLYAMGYYTSEIDVFSIDQNTGALTLQPNSPFYTQYGYPIFFTLDATGQFAYVTYQPLRSPSPNGAISAYKIDPASGSFTLVPGSPFIVPRDPAANSPTFGATPNWAASDPISRFLYVTDDHQFDLWTFSIDPTSGALTLSPSSPMHIPQGANQFTIDPGGNFAYFTTNFPNPADCGNYYPFTNVHAMYWRGTTGLHRFLWPVVNSPSCTGLRSLGRGVSRLAPSQYYGQRHLLYSCSLAFNSFSGIST